MIDGPLSQEEIDALLRSRGGEEEEGQGGHGEPEMPEHKGVHGDAWPCPESPLTDEDMDVLAEVANISMGSAATAVSALVQRKVVITAPSVSVSTPREVWEQFELPTVTVEVRYVQGLKGKNLLILRPRDAAVIADLMMGNDGLNPPEELDELRLSAVSEAMNQMMGASATAMSEFFKLKVDITPPEAQLTEAGDRSPLSSSEPMVAVSFWLRIENLIDSNFVQLMPFPFAIDLVRMARQVVGGEASGAGGGSAEAGAAVSGGASGAAVAGPGSLGGAAGDVAPVAAAAEPAMAMRGAMSAAAASPAGTVRKAGEPGADVQRAVFPTFQEAGADVEEPSPLHNVSLELIRHIPVEISACLGEAELSLKDLLRLTTGALVQLTSQENDLVRIYANGVEIARGEVVVVGEYYGVRITDIVGPAQRLNSLQR